MNVQSLLFQDAMDPTRYLRIKEERNTTVVAKVFFAHRQGLVFHGTVELPKHLFYLEGSSRTGFNVSRDPSEQPPKRNWDRKDDERDSRYRQQY